MEEVQKTLVTLVEPLAELKVTDDKLTVLLSCNVEYAREPEVLERIQVQVNRKAIKSQVQAEEVTAVMKKAAESGIGVIDLVIAQGKQPVEPQDGYLAWSREDYFTDGWYIDPETNRIDFRQKIAAPLVEKDDLLVKVIPARSGKDGCDVYGTVLRVRQARVAELRGSPNAYWDEEERGFRAKCPGRVRLTGRTLDVENAYRINGNVSNDTGNIKHNGPVEICGDLEAGFVVEAAGNIEVRGMIGASEIICGGNLTTKGGMNQSPEKNIDIKGDIYAKYINNAMVKSEGNVFADREIVQSTIYASGEITSADRIVGGEMMAGKGITAGQTGSKGDTKTILYAGMDFRLRDSMKANTDEIDELNEMLNKLEKGVKQLKASRVKLAHKQREAMTELEFKMMEIQEESTRLEGENNKIRAIIFAGRGAKIKVLNMAYPGTIFRILDGRLELDEPLVGPIVANYDIATKGIKLSSDIEEGSE